MSVNTKSSRHVWGIWLAFGGGLLCINPYFVLFAFPIALVGTGLIWASDLTAKWKIMFSLLPWLLPTAFYALIISYNYH